MEQTGQVETDRSGDRQEETGGDRQTGETGGEGGGRQVQSYRRRQTGGDKTGADRQTRSRQTGADRQYKRHLSTTSNSQTPNSTMAKTKELSKDTRNKIVDLHQAGKTESAIELLQRSDGAADTDKLVGMATFFKNRWRVPQCVGGRDGSHIPIIAPEQYARDYYNPGKDGIQLFYKWLWTAKVSSGMYVLAIQGVCTTQEYCRSHSCGKP
ncbi:hypothetical protein L3Q82_007032 [Scortum barcoo]|uniref:Uncharacterized protein n=1 Tax=Scortum barcoo TaxID=214431 RepID=A0ACB8WVZ6_9TELE|nr:hypothetical protein L3Q82_007032 [Scortum barcoo]